VVREFRFAEEAIRLVEILSVVGRIAVPSTICTRTASRRGKGLVGFSRNDSLSGQTHCLIHSPSFSESGVEHAVLAWLVSLGEAGHYSPARFFAA
jgi:hypothetical protein